MTPAPGLFLANCGPVFFDVVLADFERPPAPGEEVYARTCAVLPGGVFTTAAHLAALGVRPTLRTRLGNDPLSAYIEGELIRAGVSLDCVERVPEPARALTIAVAGEGERMLLSYTDPMPPPHTDTAVLDRVPAGVPIHFGGLVLGPDVAKALQRARGRGSPVSMDCQWGPPPTLADGALRAVLAELDVFMPNAREAVRITGAVDPATAAAALAQAGPALALVKDGAAGVWVARAGRPPYRVPAPVVARVVDTTGAGDAFNAGYWAARLTGADDRTAAAVGTVVASHSVTAAGGATARLSATAAFNAAQALLAGGV